MQNEDQLTGDELVLYQTQLHIYVSFTSFMTGVVVFFVGLLLSTFHNYDISIKIPISFLIISIFGFMYSTLIYTGAADEVSKKQKNSFFRHIFLGDVLSEYLGIYLLVLSIPLVVGAITNDSFLKATSIISALAGLTIYQFSHVSMVERHFKGRHTIISWIITLLGLAMVIAQNNKIYFTQISIIFLIFMIAITYAATKKSNF